MKKYMQELKEYFRPFLRINEGFFPIRASFTFCSFPSITQCFNYTAVSTNRLSQHFRVANSIENARRWDNVFIGSA